jgi:hypothetical protein
MQYRIYFFIILFLLGIAVSSTAQNVGLGFKAGGTYTAIAGDSLKSQYKVGYQGGVFAELDILDGFGIQPELLLTQSTSRINTFAGDTVGKEVAITYLAIPVMLRITIKEWLTFHLGAEFSYKIRENDSFFQNGEDAFTKGTTALIGGIQLNIKALRIYGRYNIGISNINSANDSKSWKYRQVQLGVGIRI